MFIWKYIVNYLFEFHYDVCGVRLIVFKLLNNILFIFKGFGENVPGRKKRQFDWVSIGRDGEISA